MNILLLQTAASLPAGTGENRSKSTLSQKSKVSQKTDKSDDKSDKKSKGQVEHAEEFVVGG